MIDNNRKAEKILLRVFGLIEFDLLVALSNRSIRDIAKRAIYMAFLSLFRIPMAMEGFSRYFLLSYESLFPFCSSFAHCLVLFRSGQSE